MSLICFWGTKPLSQGWEFRFTPIKSPILKYSLLSLNPPSGRRFFTDQRSSWGKSLVASRGNSSGQQPASWKGCEVFRISSYLSLLFFHWSAQTTSGRLSSLGGGRCLGSDVQGVLKEHLHPKRDVPPPRGGTCNSIHILLFIDLHIIAFSYYKSTVPWHHNPINHPARWWHTADHQVFLLPWLISLSWFSSLFKVYLSLTWSS